MRNVRLNDNVTVGLAVTGIMVGMMIGAIAVDDGSADIDNPREQTGYTEAVEVARDIARGRLPIADSVHVHGPDCGHDTQVILDLPAIRAQEFFDAVRRVESNDGQMLYGAAGEIGPYQILHPYWQDGTQQLYRKHRAVFATFADRDYNDVLDDERYCETVMAAYFERYAPNMLPETIARIHNGGPRGHQKTATVGYWERIKNELGDGFDLETPIDFGDWLN